MSLPNEPCRVWWRKFSILSHDSRTWRWKPVGTPKSKILNTLQGQTYTLRQERMFQAREGDQGHMQTFGVKFGSLLTSGPATTPLSPQTITSDGQWKSAFKSKKFTKECKLISILLEIYKKKKCVRYSCVLWLDISKYCFSCLCFSSVFWMDWMSAPSTC